VPGIFGRCYNHCGIFGLGGCRCNHFWLLGLEQFLLLLLLVLVVTWHKRISHEFPALARKAGMPVIRFHDCRHTAASIMLILGIPPIIVAGMLGHSLAILMTTYTHFIPGTQEEAARLMDDILTPIPIDLRDLKREKS
jgi:hypothetical protein